MVFRLTLLFVLSLFVGQAWSYASTASLIYAYDASRYSNIEQNSEFSDEKFNYNSNPNFFKFIDVLQPQSNGYKFLDGSFFALIDVFSATKSGASNIANGPKLAKQLRLESANSPFTKSGHLTDDAIKNSREIIPSSAINNPAIPKGFSKYSTGTHQSPSGNFQTHFYKNSKTGEVFYGNDYKAIFNSKSGG